MSMELRGEVWAGVVDLGDISPLVFSTSMGPDEIIQE